MNADGLDNFFENLYKRGIKMVANKGYYHNGKYYVSRSAYLRELNQLISEKDNKVAALNKEQSELAAKLESLKAAAAETEKQDAPQKNASPNATSAV